MTGMVSREGGMRRTVLVSSASAELDGRQGLTVDCARTTHEKALARSLLDGERPADTAALKALDAALLRGSTDPTLHAAVLLLACSAGGDLRLERSRPKRWVLGLDELIDCGHVDAAAYAAPRLNAAFPWIPYLANMTMVLRRVPAAVGHGRQPLVDNRDSDVHVVPMPGADTIVFAFCGIGHRLGLPLSLVDRWFAQLDSHVVYLRDRRRVGFTRGIPALGHDLATTFDGLIALAGDLGGRRVFCTGTSAGASGALRDASALGAERVLALAPITGGPNDLLTIAPDPLSGEETPWGDLVPFYRDGAGVRARVMYEAGNAGDRRHSLRLAGSPNVSVEAIPDWESHHVVSGLIRFGRLSRVYSWLTSKDDVLEPGWVVSSAAQLP